MNQDQQKPVHRRLLSYLYPYRKRFLCALGAMVMFGATDGAVPILLKKILDDIFGAKHEQMLWYLVTAIVIFAFVRGFFGFWQKYLAATVGLRIVRDIRNEINEHLLTLSPAFFGQNPSGTLLSRMTNDTLLVRTAVTDAVASMLRDSIRVIALLCAAVYLDPVLALIAVVGFPLAIYPIMKFGKRVRKLSRAGQDIFGDLTSILHESIIGHKIVQSFCREDFEQGRFVDENNKVTRTWEKAEKYAALVGPTNEVVASIAVGLVVVYGGLSVMSGVRTQGDFIAFITAMFLLYEPVKKLGRVNNTVQRGLAAAERIFEVLDAKPEIAQKEDALGFDGLNTHIEYRSVSFRYSEDGEEAALTLEDINLDVAPGQTVALVGTSGGGKSTLVNLLPRFYDPVSGGVFIGERDIRDYTLKSLRTAVSVVSQHTFLFNDTLFHNIAYGRPEATVEEVIAAAQAAKAHEFIMRLPGGYDTVIGEQGYRLSGGERSRIAIARALLKDSPILILDEATAALDSESEKLVQEAIDRLMEGRTVLVIAHRLATVRRANQIAVVVGGKIVERGTHDELLERGAEYAKLHSIQFQDEFEEGKRQAGNG